MVPKGLVITPPLAKCLSEREVELRILLPICYSATSKGAKHFLADLCCSLSRVESITASILFPATAPLLPEEDAMVVLQCAHIRSQLDLEK